MLVAYHEGYLFLIKVCALFCVLVLAYSLYSHLTLGRREKQQKKRIEALKALLAGYEEAVPNVKKKQTGRIANILKKPVGLLALLGALDELGWMESDQIPPRTRLLLCEQLTELYVKKYRRSEVYVHSLLINLFIRCDVTSSRVKALLLDCLDSTQLLVQIETLRCICAHRNRKMVLIALERISREKLPFSNKLITDTLMTFRGDRKALMEELWQNLLKFSPEVQVSVLQMLSAMGDAGYAKRVLQLMSHPKTDMEVRIAGIKYFADARDEACVPVLADYLSDDTWEYAAVAARTLANYDCSGIFDRLLKGTGDRNWYVRTNCAAAIVRACRADQVQEALNTADRYGRDSVRYALNMMQKEEVTA